MTSTIEFSSFHFEVKSFVAHIVLNRSDKRNCLIREFWYELPQAIKLAERRADVRCILLRSEGRVFSSGIDLGVLEGLKKMGESLESSRRADHLRRTVLSLQNSISCLEDTRLPVIAAIQGACIGGALDLVCAADIRIAESAATFTPLEMDLGFVPDLGTVQRLTATLPYGVVADWLMDCRTISGDEANNMGFVSRVSADRTELKLLAITLAERIANRSPVAVIGAKELMKFTKEHGVKASLRYTAAWQSGVFPGKDLETCIRARQEKIHPELEGMADEQNLYGVEDTSYQ
ncbi:MAG: enoyl-CoA hydratase-related protein [Bacteroidota bacterium]